MTKTGMSPQTPKEWIRLATEVLSIEREGLAAVEAAIGEDFVAALSLMARCAGRIVLTGIGKSGLVGRKIAATLSSTGTPAFFLHPVEGAHGDMGMMRPEDVVVAISYSGETDEVNALVPSLKGLVSKVIAITGALDSTLAGLADVTLCVKVPREACPLGLAPTASTTATLALGDALAVCLIQWKSFDARDFKRYHPGGALGQRLCDKVSEFMHPCQGVTVAPDMPFVSALHVLNEGGLGAVVVVDGANRLMGILTDGDIRRMLCAGKIDDHKPVGEYMMNDPLWGTPEQSAAEVLDSMEAREITVLPVVDSTMTLVGVVHMHDLLGKGRVRFAAASLD